MKTAPNTASFLKCSFWFALFALRSKGLVDFGDDVVSAALDCHDRQAVSLWLEKNGTIQWRFTAPQPKAPRNLTAQALFHPFSVLKSP